MSEFDKNGGYNSPMDVVFSWATPQTGESSTSAKRKSEDDSGYISPFSTKTRPVQSTPYEGSGSSGFCEGSFTPFVGGGGDAKKRLNVNVQSDLYSSVSNAESYSEFLLETSLYSEPMELGTSSLGSSQEDCKDSLSSSELTKDLDVEFHMSSCEPITPDYLPPKKVALSTVKRTPKKCQAPEKRHASSAPSQVIFYNTNIFKKRRNFTGVEKVDFLYQLNVKSHYPSTLSKILGYLSDSDLSRVTMVSKTWRSVCLADTAAKSRWHSYVNERKQNRENLPIVPNANTGKSKRQSLSVHNHSTPRKHLRDVRQPTSPPVSPSKIRFHMFQKEARNLKENEVLMECPRCRRPSTCSPSLRLGECKSISCQWKFCTICKMEPHPRGACLVLTPATPTTPTKSTGSIGTKQSRKNLRRL